MLGRYLHANGSRCCKQFSKSFRIRSINITKKQPYPIQSLSKFSFCTTPSSDTAKKSGKDDKPDEVVDTTPFLKPSMQENIETSLENRTFQTETRQLLDIVANSLYTDKEVFLRELLSNASDALEKIRYLINKGDSDIKTPEIPLEINVFTDKEKGILVIQDSGIGMNDKEMISNLGTIARSGSKLFVQQINESLSSDNESELESRNSNTYMNNAEAIIGQFGVGFYSVFMVCDKVEVYSNPCALEDEFEFDDNDTNTNNDNINTGYYWTSDGSGDYSIARASNVLRGTKIIVHLKKEARKEFCDKYRIEGIIKKYSSYLEFPIKLNGSLITSTGAIWQKKPSEVTKIQYKDFFQLLSDRYDDPYYIYHSHFDSSKFSAQCLIYFPETHEERFGSKRLQPGINLYCRKVLVQRNCKDIIPDWLRFVKGVIDSENIPIHISRENMQDSVLIKQLQESIMMKIVDFLKRQSSKDEKRYLKWYEDYKGFLKEGVCSDYHNRSRIAKLLRFETNIKNENELMSLDDYIDDLEERKEAAGTGGDKKASASDIKDEIYYLVAPTRETALNSPYIEAFQNRNIPVFLCYAQIDEFVMKVLGSYRGKEIIGIESSTTSVKHEFKNKKGSNKDKDNDPPLTKDDCRRLGKWMRKEFPKLVESCEITYRLDSHPAVFVDHQAQSLRHYLKAANEETKLPPQRMQVNPNHNIIKGLYREIQENNEDKAKLLCKQLINNACIAAGIIDDARNMLADLNLVMEMALGYDPTHSNVDTNENDNSDNTQDTDSEETIEARKAAKKAQDEKDSFESQYQTLQ